MIKAFLRNDDVRDSLDDSLRYLTQKALDVGIPIIHAVEPANLKQEVADWLLKIKQQCPELIEIIMHGYTHRIKTPAHFRGEFGGGRPYEDQKNEIGRGIDLMNHFFSDHWSRIFSFPYGSYDQQTLLALESFQFKIITTGIRFTWRRILLNRIGRLLKKKFLMDKCIVYFNEQIPGSSLHEIPVVINNTKIQTGPNSGIQKTSEDMIREWEKLPGFLKTRGILCHHRFNVKKDIDQLIDFVLSLKKLGVHFFQMGNLHEKMDYM